MLSRTSKRRYCSLKQLLMLKAAQTHTENRSDNDVATGPLKRTRRHIKQLTNIFFFISGTFITHVDSYSPF